MKTFTLHLPADALPGDPEPLEKAVLVRDGFSWGAFFFTVLWFFAHRLWLAGLGVLALLVAFNLGLSALGVRPGAAFLADLLLSVLIGLEANSLRRWTLQRRGRPAVDLVTASSRDEAETKAFARWLARESRPQASAASAPLLRVPVAPYRTPDPVIGFFPDPGRGR
ncbi:MAG TPA: DUF2628 domain-containing protein [Microvirga sp.]|nr:DUF2628 domain-containing protein [Microvirga sp.]